MIHTLYARELEVKAGQSGSFTMNIDACNLLNPQPPSPVPSFMMQMPSKPKKVHISSMQIVQSIQTRLTASDVLSITGTATASEGKGMGIAVMTYQHTLSPDQMISLSTLCGSRNQVVCEVVQSLTSDCQGAVSMGYGNQGFETGVKIAKQFKENLVGSLHLSLEKVIECTIETEYVTPQSKLSTSLFVGHDLGGSVSYLHTLHKELGVRGKVHVKASLSDLMIETMLGKDLSSFSKVNLNVGLGFSGVTLKFKYQRGNMNFVLPILLSKNLLDVKSIAVAYGVSAMTAGLSALYYKSFMAKNHQAY